MSIASAALVVMLGNIASRLLGLVREQTIAALFGRTVATDALTAAWRVPTTLYDLLIGGMISAALVPVFASHARPEAIDEFRRLAGAALGLALLALGVVALGILLLAGPLMAIVSPGLATHGLAVELEATRYLRLMVPGLVCMGISGLLTALLYARQRFAVPAFAAAAFNAGIVLTALVLHRWLGVASLAAGLVIGAAAQLFLTWLGLRTLGIRPRWEPRHPGLRQILRLYLPVALGLLVSAVGVGIDTNLASRTPPGDLTAMRYATTLVQLPLGLIATALGTAILPVLAQQHAMRREPSSPADQATDPDETLGRSLRWTLLLILPAAITLVVFREPIIRLLFERGQFGAADTARTALAFLAYAPGIPAAAIDQLLITACYARKDTVTPVVVGVVSVGIYLTVALILVGPLGMVGLALANSVQWLGHAAIMLTVTGRHAGGLRAFRLGGIAIRAGGAGLAMTAAMIELGQLAAMADSLVLRLLAIAVVATVGMVIYLGLLIVTRCDEVERAVRLLAARLRQSLEVPSARSMGSD